MQGIFCKEKCYTMSHTHTFHIEVVSPSWIKVSKMVDTRPQISFKCLLRGAEPTDWISKEIWRHNGDAQVTAVHIVQAHSHIRWPTWFRLCLNEQSQLLCFAKKNLHRFLAFNDRWPFLFLHSEFILRLGSSRGKPRCRYTTSSHLETLGEKGVGGEVSNFKQ